MSISIGRLALAEGKSANKLAAKIVDALSLQLYIPIFANFIFNVAASNAY